MPRLLTCLLAAGVWMSPALAAAPGTPGGPPGAVAAKGGAPDSKQIERDLQRLSWRQFRFVIESVPEMKADVEAYGPVGWKFVESRYATHGWKKSVDKLDAAEKQRLVELIRAAREMK